MLWLRLTATSNCFPHPHKTLPCKPLLWASARRISPSPPLSRESNCKEWAYRSVSNILCKSRVLVFVLLGDNDINNCEDALNAEELWTKYFQRKDKRWDNDFEVTRWRDLDESFSFLWGWTSILKVFPMQIAQCDHSVHQCLKICFLVTSFPPAHYLWYFSSSGFCELCFYCLFILRGVFKMQDALDFWMRLIIRSRPSIWSIEFC